MPLYKSQFQEINFNAEHSILENSWTLKSEYMTQEQYKEELMKLSEFFHEFRPEKQLINTQDFIFPITPELQEWTDENILKPHSKSTKLKKVAFIVSEEIFSQVSLEQTMEEEHGRLFNTRYFENKEDALAWLG